MDHKSVVIIGSGPAAFTAAIYCSRAGLRPLVIEGPTPGGQLTTTTEVENFPGFPEGIDGNQLMENMKKQASRFGAEFLSSTVTKTDLSNRPFKVTCENGKGFFANAIIVATGASARYLGLPQEKELIGKGVSACATCDGPFFRDKIVHVVGGGDTALEEALFLSKFASCVYIVHRRGQLRASKAMQQKVVSNPKIEFVWDTIVSEIVADEYGVVGIRVENVKTHKVSKRKTDGLFLGIGHTPNTSFLKGQIETDSLGFIITKNDCETNVPGVFACGDVQDPKFRQAITAAGSGCISALKTEQFLG